MTPDSRKALEAIVHDLDRWLKKHGSVYIAGLKGRLEDVLRDEPVPTWQGSTHNGHYSAPYLITPCERISYEKCLDRIDEQMKRMMGQVSHDAWGPRYTSDQSLHIKELKAKKKEILHKLGLPI